jgi:polar amino acid transport system substrate-binding protein
MSMQRRWSIVLLVVMAMLAAACGTDDTTTDGDGTTSCAVDDLNLITAGTLTVATGEPAFPPWVSGADGANFDDPESGTGFEAALVYEIAAEMGFTADQVVWVRTGFDEAVVAGPKTFDFNIQQYSFTSARDEVVDFSDPYYTTRQAVVGLPGSAVVGVTSLDDLKDARLGASIGSTSFDFIEDVIQPNTKAAVYDTVADAKAALDADQLDGIVVDLPTAYFIAAVEIEDAIIAAQFGPTAAAPDEYGLLFAEGNSLVGCVNQALGALRAAGRLDALEEEWLAQGGGIVTISP